MRAWFNRMVNSSTIPPDKEPIETRNLSGLLASDHTSCDELWVEFEDTAGAERDGAAGLWKRFRDALYAHLDAEEQVLFPAFEEAVGPGGPVMVMRSEHEQMRVIVETIDDAVASEDWSRAVDEGDTLLMLIGQHNAKEEGMLYPMADQALQAQLPDLAAKMQALLKGHGS